MMTPIKRVNEEDLAVEKFSRLLKITIKATNNNSSSKPIINPSENLLPSHQVNINL